MFCHNLIICIIVIWTITFIWIYQFNFLYHSQSYTLRWTITFTLSYQFLFYHCIQYCCFVYTWYQISVNRTLNKYFKLENRPYQRNQSIILTAVWMCNWFVLQFQPILFFWWGISTSVFLWSWKVSLTRKQQVVFTRKRWMQVRGSGKISRIVFLYHYMWTQ